MADDNGERSEEEVVRAALGSLGDGARTLEGEPWRAALAPLRVRETLRSLRRALLRQNYTEVAAKELLGVGRLAAQGAWPRLSRPMEEVASQLPSARRLSEATLALLGTFLLNASVPNSVLEAALSHGRSASAGRDGRWLAVELEEMGILWRTPGTGHDATRWRSAVQIAPVDAGSGHPSSSLPMLFLVDWDELRPWHQVMTATIDSYALLQVQKLAHSANAPRRILDLCSGSGIQGLHAFALAASKAVHASATLVDLNPRALRFAKANVLLNGLRRITLQSGSLYEALPQPCVDIACNSTAARFDLILANPPYVPSMGGGQMFVAGGPTGEAVTEAIVRGASRALAPGGRLMLVANLANVHHGFPSKLADWWHGSVSKREGGGGVAPEVDFQVFHGDLWSSAEYAGGFIGSDEDRARYRGHLRDAGVATMTNAFIFARRPAHGRGQVECDRGARQCSGTALRLVPGLWHALVDTSHQGHTSAMRAARDLLIHADPERRAVMRVRRQQGPCPCARCVCSRIRD